MTPCVWCDQPEEGHGVRYSAMVGAHEWTAPQTGTDWPVVPHPLGGITYPVDPSQAAQWWEDTDPDPVPGGDRLPNSTYRKASS